MINDDLLGEMKDWWENRYRSEQFIWGEEPSECTRSVIDFLKDRGVKRILDLPCGYGRDSIFLAKNGFEVMGIDRCGEAIKLAKEYARREGLEISFIEGDATQLDMPDDSFDAIVSNRFLHLVYEDELQDKVAKEMHRVIRKDGYLVLATRSTEDPDCNEKNSIEGKVHELQDRRGHMIRFNTHDEIKSVFSHFKELTIEKMQELESLERRINCSLLRIIARK
ncbi:MAG: class I SAM-dependent methyltransferase [Candidatus Altiarchaeota archaeon]